MRGYNLIQGKYTWKSIALYDKMSYTVSMILIGRKLPMEFGMIHPNGRNALAAWERIITQTNYRGFNELKRSFASVDYVYHRYTIFDIGGNKFRLITEIDYQASVVNVLRVFTHAEYSMKKNEDLMRRGRL